MFLNDNDVDDDDVDDDYVDDEDVDDEDVDDDDVDQDDGRVVCSVPWERRGMARILNWQLENPWQCQAGPHARIIIITLYQDIDITPPIESCDLSLNII